MDWIGNVCIVIGLWFIGSKKRWAFIFSVIGEVSWIIYSLTRPDHLYSLAIICAVFASMAVRGWVKWGKNDQLAYVKSFVDTFSSYNRSGHPYVSEVDYRAFLKACDTGVGVDGKKIEF